MQKLPALTGVQLVKALKRAGFIEDRQKGSHLILIHPVSNVRIVIPVHAGKTIKKPLLRAIIKDSQLTTEKFLRLL